MLITNIKQLINIRESTALLRGNNLAELPVIENAFLFILDNKISDYGSMNELARNKKYHLESQEIVDAKQASVLPSWCDSHTHIIFASSRESEFIDKLKGKSYAEIAAKGGGILNSAKQLQMMNEEDLLASAQLRLNEIIQFGTGAVEIKSGYGLSLDAEIKMLRVIQQLKRQNEISIKATFLGAHAIPMSFKDNRNGYIDLVINEMLPRIAEEQLADFIDVFCEEGFFTQAETEMICNAGIALSLKPKIHANQLHNSGGVQAGVNTNAISVDHLETIGQKEIELLSHDTAPIATLLPGAAFFLRMQYPPARKLIENNAAVAIASDYNPGSSPSGNMNLVVAMACIQMKMLPEEAINAATINGAFAMELENEVGSITIGKKANFIFTKEIPSLAYLPYSFGNNLIDKVMINGKFV